MATHAGSRCGATAAAALVVVALASGCRCDGSGGAALPEASGDGVTTAGEGTVAGHADASALAVRGFEALMSPERVALMVRAHRSEHWYGMYIGDRKVAYARLWLRPSKSDEPGGFASGMETVMRLEDGDGDVTTEETDYYAAEPPYRLIEARRIEASPQGRSEQRYTARGDALIYRDLSSTSAGGERELRATGETVLAALSQFALEPAALAIGQAYQLVEFDAETERDRTLTVRVADISRRPVAGAAVQVAELDYLFEGDEVPVRLVMAPGGAALELRLGPQVRMLLEDRELARSGVQGVGLLSSSIAVDRALGDPSRIRELALELDLPPGFALPTGPNQRVRPLPGGRVSVQIQSVPGEPVTDDARAAALVTTGRIDASNPELRALAARITAGMTTGDARARALNAWVFNNLTKDLATNLATASQVLEQRVGDCTEHALLFVALARSVGLPAREISGLTYIGDDVQRFGWHAWAEVAVDGRWVQIDPSWGEPVANATHIKLDDRGSTDWVATMAAIAIHAPAPPAEIAPPARASP